jgi:hypothetical protein
MRDMWDFDCTNTGQSDVLKEETGVWLHSDL